MHTEATHYYTATRWNGGPLGFVGTWRGLGLIALVLALQVLAIHVLPATESTIVLKRVLVVAGHIFALMVAWRVRRVWGTGLVLLGMVLNLTVMLANGGAMPVTPELHTAKGAPPESAMVGADIPRSKGILLLQEETRLWLLSDTVLLPTPVRKAVSVGDLLIVTGLALAMVHITRIALRAGPTSSGTSDQAVKCEEQRLFASTSRKPSMLSQ